MRVRKGSQKPQKHTPTPQKNSHPYVNHKRGTSFSGPNSILKSKNKDQNSRNSSPNPRNQTQSIKSLNTKAIDTPKQEEEDSGFNFGCIPSKDCKFIDFGMEIQVKSQKIFTPPEMEEGGLTAKTVSPNESVERW